MSQRCSQVVSSSGPWDLSGLQDPSALLDRSGPPDRSLPPHPWRPRVPPARPGPWGRWRLSDLAHHCLRPALSGLLGLPVQSGPWGPPVPWGQQRLPARPGRWVLRPQRDLWGRWDLQCPSGP